VISQVSLRNDDAISPAWKQTLLNEAARLVTDYLVDSRYACNFDWLGLPITQFPADIVALQEICWKVKPAVLVETGVARGGSTLFYASMLEWLGSDGFVLGVDVGIRGDIRQAMKAHPLARRIRLVEGSSVDPAVAPQVGSMVGARGPVLVVLDSQYTKEHALAGLDLYSPRVGPGSYVVVQDTTTGSSPKSLYENNGQSKGRLPADAVEEFLHRPGCRFTVDEDYAAKLLFTRLPRGFLRCVA